VSGVIAKLGWYRNRLQLMSVPEVLHRAREAVGQRLSRVGTARPVPQPQRLEFGRPWCEAWPADIDPTPYVRAADRLLAGRWNVFALRDVELGFPPRWNVDPLTGKQAPLEYGKTLDYRDERRVGNIKYLWEPSRHLELVTLAQAWRLGGERRHLEAIGRLLGSWFEQCPYPLGVHWASALEAALRLLNWAVAWHLIGGARCALFEGEGGARLRQAWLEAVYRHAEFVRGFRSRYSSANNHLLGENMGLLIAGVTWRCWDESERWRSEGARGFETEALRQNAADGVNREQALYYHHEVADMMLLSGLFGEANGLRLSAAYWERLQAMLDFLAALRDAGGHLPMIGDADDALMVRFDPRADFDPYASLLATREVLFGSGAEPGSDLKTSWLLGVEPRRRGARHSGPPPDAFPEGGYWVLGDARGTAQEVHVVADAGPLGYLSIAAHGHADALSFVLSLGGREVLIDPGTYAYHTEKRWRDHFRGTSAHNTVRIDGVDQSVIGGNFMWLRKANARLVSLERGDAVERWCAEHDGYARLPDPLVHRRTIELRKRERCIVVTDALACRGAHEVELFWQCAEDADVHLEGEHVARIAVGDRVVRLQCAGARASLHRGEEHPPLGWVSRRFDHKQPTTTIRFAARTMGAADFVTRIDYGAGDEARMETA
jgi:hypothetical protein